MTKPITFTEEHEKEYLELWDSIDPCKTIDLGVDELDKLITEATPKINKLNNMVGVPNSIYKIYLPMLEVEPLIENDVIDLDFALETLPQILASFNVGKDIGIGIVYYISEHFEWHDACKFVDAAIVHIYTMYKVLKDRDNILSNKLKATLPKTIREFTTYFPDEIVDTTVPQYLVGHPKVLYSMANGEYLDATHKDVIIDCMIIALEAGLHFAKDFVINSYVGITDSVEK